MEAAHVKCNVSNMSKPGREGTPRDKSGLEVPFVVKAA